MNDSLRRAVDFLMKHFRLGEHEFSVTAPAAGPPEQSPPAAPDPHSEPWKMTKQQFASSVKTPLYHGTPRKGINQLEPRSAPQYGKAIYFSEHPKEAEDFSTHGEVHVAALKPHAKIWHDTGGFPTGHEQTQAYQNALKAIVAKHGPRHMEEIGEPMTHADAKFAFENDEDINNGELYGNIARELGYHAIRGVNHGNETAVLDPSAVTIHRQAVHHARLAGNPVPHHVLGEYADIHAST